VKPRSRPEPALAFHPATAERWRDLARLFGDRGACGGCWCMYWRLSHADFTRGKGAANRERMRRLVSAGEVPGLLAYLDGEPVGWCAIAPRAAYPRLARSRVLAPLDAAPVWSVVCFFVARPWRKRGVSVELLRAAVSLARAQGARVVEGYPVEPRGELAAAFAWTGTAAAFRRAGFVEVARRSPTRPIMRADG